MEFGALTTVVAVVAGVVLIVAVVCTVGAIIYGLTQYAIDQRLDQVSR